MARNLLTENAAVDRRQAEAADVAEADGMQALPDVPEFDTALDVAREVARLRVVLEQISPECCAAVMLKYRHGLSYQEIADRLEVSPSMVNKYLRQALSHCRRRMARLR